MGVRPGENRACETSACSTGVPRWGEEGKGAFSGVVQETVAFNSLAQDEEDDDVFFRPCRCSGRFFVPPRGGAGGREHFQCDSCSLWIKVTGL